MSTESTEFLPAVVRDVPATAKLVYRALESQGPRTKAELVEDTGQSHRQIERALSTLRDQQLVEPRPDRRERRRYVWCPTE